MRPLWAVPACHGRNKFSDACVLAVLFGTKVTVCVVPTCHVGGSFGFVDQSPFGTTLTHSPMGQPPLTPYRHWPRILCLGGLYYLLLVIVIYWPRWLYPGHRSGGLLACTLALGRCSETWAAEAEKWLRGRWDAALGLSWCWLDDSWSLCAEHISVRIPPQAPLHERLSSVQRG